MGAHDPRTCESCKRYPDAREAIIREEARRRADVRAARRAPAPVAPPTESELRASWGDR